MKEDTPDLTAIGLPNEARSLKVGSAAANWEVFPENHYEGFVVTLNRVWITLTPNKWVFNVINLSGA